MAEESDYGQNYSENFGGVLKIKDLEEKQNIMKDRLLLIGKNLIDAKENSSEKLLEIKKELETLKHDVERIKSFIEMISGELGKFARREDLEILSKQAKMFQPLEFVRKSDLKKFSHSREVGG